MAPCRLVGHQNGNKPTALRMIEKERISPSAHPFQLRTLSFPGILTRRKGMIAIEGKAEMRLWEGLRVLTPRRHQPLATSPPLRS